MTQKPSVPIRNNREGNPCKRYTSLKNSWAILTASLTASVVFLHGIIKSHGCFTEAIFFTRSWASKNKSARSSILEPPSLFQRFKQVLQLKTQHDIIDQEFVAKDNDEQPADKEVTKADWFKKPEQFLTLDPDWNKRRQVDC
ncbi:hypothetical protein Tco_0008991 [Tanacetum coccineum]